MKYSIFLLIIIFCVVSDASALNNNVKVTPTPVLEKFSESFYGNINYFDGHPVMAGSTIVTKDQYGNLLGNYTLREDGVYGSTMPRGENLVVSLLLDPTNRTSRSTVIFINFFVDGIRATDTIEFKQGEVLNYDIKLSANYPTPVPTTIPTTVITTVPTTEIPTTVITTVPTPEPNILIKIITPEDSDQAYLIYGLIGFVLIISGIGIITIIHVFLASKASRDDVIGPEDKD